MGVCIGQLWARGSIGLIVLVAKPAIVYMIGLTRPELKDTAVNVTLVMALRHDTKSLQYGRYRRSAEVGGDINYSIFITTCLANGQSFIPLAYFYCSGVGGGIEWVMIVLLERPCKIVLTSKEFNPREMDKQPNR
ncbi:hypothetical protein O9929_25260 [Vibrio lentus]|nr:hypothetical protein [Vibrio lentus]